MSAAQAGLVSRLANRTKRLRTASADATRPWQDNAARTTRTRHLDPLLTGATDLELALSQHGESADAARKLAALMVEQAELCTAHLDRAMGELQDGEAQLRVASQHIDSTHALMGEFEQRLDEALALLGQAGGDCGQASGKAAVKSQLDERLAADRKRAAQLAVAREALIQLIPHAAGELVERVAGVELTNVDEIVAEVIGTARDPGLRSLAGEQISSAVASVRGRLFGG